MIHPSRPRRTDLRARSIDAEKVFIKDDGTALTLDSEGRIIIPAGQQVAQNWRLATIQITTPTNTSNSGRYENTFSLSFSVLTDTVTSEPLIKLYLNGLKLNKNDFSLTSQNTLLTKTEYELDSNDNFEIWYVI